MRLQNFFLTLTACLAMSTLSFAQTQDAPPAGGDAPPQHHHPRLTDEQKSCLKDHGVHGPGQGTPPSHEQFEAAAKACHVPPMHHHPKDGQAAPDAGAQPMEN